MGTAAENMQRRAIREMVTEFLVKQGRVPEDVAANGATLVGELGLDSLDMVEMIFEVEEKYGIRIDDMNQLKDMTIDGLVDLMYSLAADKAVR